jgi:Rhodopirellula transposase DDE domain
MEQATIHQCECELCQARKSPEIMNNHHLMNVFMSRLDEQGRRWYAALEASKLGHGGLEHIAKITGLHVNTIRRGQAELAHDLAERPNDRVRVEGGGRQRLEKKSPELEAVLTAIVADDLAGLPSGPAQWVRKSLSNLAQALTERAYAVSPTTVKRLLEQLDFGLMANRKSLIKVEHPDQDLQFRYIKQVKKLFLEAGFPVISVDAKDKKMVGNFANAGQSWRQQAEPVLIHDFPSDGLGVAKPYGIYDLRYNQGHVYVGTSADTPEFAAYCIAQWWSNPARPRFEREDLLLIFCDAGGSNNCRFWLWKQEVQQQLANQFGLQVMICHYPTGHSRYNPIEYRLFSQISLNWAGKPLRSFQTMLNFIRGTTNKTGLAVRAFLVDRLFETGRSVSEQERQAIKLTRRPICPNWNYVISPQQILYT